MLHMVLWLYTHVSRVCFNSFVFRCMLQVFYLDVTLLQVYVPNVLFVSGVCCIVSSKCCKTDLDIGMEEA
jgi:hypothetical protein